MVSENRIATAHPSERENMLACYEEMVRETPANVHPYVDQVFITIEESNALYQKGRNAEGLIVNPSAVVSNAKGGESWHNYGLAWDLHIIRNGVSIWFDSTPEGAAKASNDADYASIIKIAEKYGYTWGGNFTVGTFRDVPHFENQRGQTLKQLFADYQAKKFIQGTNYVII
jgi:peptidoglycan L-alanyl-D-glutamate endopeptidase CwlK